MNNIKLAPGKCWSSVMDAKCASDRPGICGFGDGEEDK
jgi:hypothetical protein